MHTTRHARVKRRGVALFDAIIGGVMRLNARFDAKVREVGLRSERIEQELAAYKLEAAEKYASVGHLKDVEARLVVSIDRLADRIDRLINRIDRRSDEGA